MTAERVCFALVYMAEAMMAWLYFERLFYKNKSTGTVLSCILTAHCALFALSFAGSLALNASGFFLVNLILLTILYQCNIKTALFHSAFMSFMMIGAEVVVSLLLSSVGSSFGGQSNNFTVYTHSLSVMVTLSAGSKLLYFLGIMLSARISRPHKDEYADVHFTILLCSLPLASMFVAATIVFVGMNYILSGWLEILMACCVLALLAVNILVLIIYDRIAQLCKEKAALQISAVKDKAQLEYYTMLSKQYNDQRIFIHDFKNHLSVLSSLSAGEEIEQIKLYLNGLSEMPELKSRTNICSDPVLNMMLINLYQRCTDVGVTFNYQIRSCDFGFMDAVSKSSLFGNLLSNAFEAASTSTEKIIELSVFLGDTGNNLIISIENSCDTAPQANRHGIYISTKKTGKNHGLGISSIERTVEKYNGMSKMYYDADKKRFHCIINVPVS